MYEVRIPGSDALRDIADLVDQVHRLRLAITGTSTQPGLLAQVESARPVVDQLSDSLVELREQNLGAIELVQHLEAISRELLVEIPDRLLGTLQSQLFAERLTVALVDVVVAMAEVVSNTQLEIAAEQLSAKAGQDARQLIDEILARNEAARCSLSISRFVRWSSAMRSRSSDSSASIRSPWSVLRPRSTKRRGLPNA